MRSNSMQYPLVCEFGTGQKVKPLVLRLQLQLEMLQDLQKKYKPARVMNHNFINDLNIP